MEYRKLEMTILVVIGHTMDETQSETSGHENPGPVKPMSYGDEDV